MARAVAHLTNSGIIKLSPVVNLELLIDRFLHLLCHLSIPVKTASHPCFKGWPPKIIAKRPLAMVDFMCIDRQQPTNFVHLRILRKSIGCAGVRWRINRDRCASLRS